MNETLEKYISLFPVELRRAIFALSDQERDAIIMALRHYGEFSFSNFEKYFGNIDRNRFENQMIIMKEGGLVESRLESNNGESYYPVYRLSDFGDELIDTLLEISKQSDVSR